MKKLLILLIFFSSLTDCIQPANKHSRSTEAASRRLEKKRRHNISLVDYSDSDNSDDEGAKQVVHIKTSRGTTTLLLHPKASSATPAALAVTNTAPANPITKATSSTEVFPGGQISNDSLCEDDENAPLCIFCFNPQKETITACCKKPLCTDCYRALGNNGFITCIQCKKRTSGLCKVEDESRLTAGPLQLAGAPLQAKILSLKRVISDIQTETLYSLNRNTTRDSERLATIKECLEAGVDPNTLYSDAAHDITFFHIAAQLSIPEIVDAFLAHGANSLWQDCTGLTPLAYAAMAGNAHAVYSMLTALRKKYNINFKHTVFANGKSLIELARGDAFRYLNSIQARTASGSATAFQEPIKQDLAFLSGRAVSDLTPEELVRHNSYMSNALQVLKESPLLPVDIVNHTGIVLDEYEHFFEYVLNSNVPLTTLIKLFLPNGILKATAPLKYTALRTIEGNEEAFDYAYDTDIAGRKRWRYTPVGVNVKTPKGLSMLHYAAMHNRTGLINYLLSNGAAINATGRGIYANQTALHLAAKHGHLQAISALLKANAKQTLGDKTPLELAVENDHASVLPLLLSHEDATAIKYDDNRHTIFDIATKHNSKKCLQYFMDQENYLPAQALLPPPEQMMISLSDAITAKDVATLNSILSHGMVDVNGIIFKKNQAITPLRLAITTGCNVDIILALLYNGATVFDTDNSQEPLLLLAVKHCDLEVVNALLSAGAVGEINNTYYPDAHTPTTALHKAVFYNKPDVVNLLLSHGANPFIATTINRLPIHIAALKGHEACAQALLEYDRSYINSKDGLEETPLQLAKKSGRETVVDCLLRFGADPLITAHEKPSLEWE
ncbi:hypothetical protein FJ365_02805 [Candidatus Dependentiae bacterium]|nr:hypothetical protein [Candidatus Dependentiae bacterium]